MKMKNQSNENSEEMKKKLKEKKHLFEDGEKVRVKETGEEVTVKQWWFGNMGATRFIAQYDIIEYPSTWFSESELEKI
jgi:predicted membrane protein